MKKKEGIHEINRGKICKYPGCTHHAVVRGYCINHSSFLYRIEEKKMQNAKKEIAKLKEHLKSRPDTALIKGYKSAISDYERTKDEKIKIVAEIIKTEIVLRGLNV